MPHSEFTGANAGWLRVVPLSRCASCGRPPGLAVAQPSRRPHLYFMIYRAFALVLAASVAMIASAFAGEISLPDHRIAVTLPDGWLRATNLTTGILIRAHADSGQLQFALTRPPIPMKPVPVQDAGYQKGIKQSLIDNGFSRMIRSEIVKVAGSDAYLCEAAREDKPVSIIQVMWFHEGHPISLVFLSLAKPFKDVPDVQTIMNSVKILPKS